jgi:alkylhydroperoxidase family enzyme
MAINGASSTITPELRNMVSQMASRAAGCGYCMAHTAHTASRIGILPEGNTRRDETSPLFSAAERAALRVAQGAAQVPDAVTDDDVAELKRYCAKAAEEFGQACFVNWSGGAPLALEQRAQHRRCHLLLYQSQHRFHGEGFHPLRHD